MKRSLLLLGIPLLATIIAALAQYSPFIHNIWKHVFPIPLLIGYLTYLFVNSILRRQERNKKHAE